MKIFDHGVGTVTRGFGSQGIDDQPGDESADGGNHDQQIMMRGDEAQHLGGGGAPAGLHIAGKRGDGILQNMEQQFIENDGSDPGDYPYGYT